MTRGHLGRAFRTALRELAPPLAVRLLGMLRGKKEGRASTPEWVRISGGPLEGRYILLGRSDAVPPWQQRMAEGAFDSPMFRFLSRVLLTDAVFADVGAHLGYHSMAFAALGGAHSRVFAFEPNPSNRARLAENLAKNADLAPRVQVLEYALADRDGSSVLLSNADVDGGGSSMGYIAAAVPAAPAAAYAGARFQEQPVALARLDTLIETHRIPAPSVVKIDVEGAEDLVLCGSVQLLRTVGPLLLIEVHHALAMFRVMDQLTSFGYRVDLLDAEPDGRSHVAARRIDQ